MTVLSRGGRYQKVADNLEVKNVVVLDDETLEERRYVVCFNPQEARREALVREDVLAKLQTKLKADGIKSLVGNSSYRKYLNVDNETVTINETKVQEVIWSSLSGQ